MISHFLASLLVLNLFIFSPMAHAADAAAPSSTKPAKKTDAKGGKAQAYSGDPALKRGFELGYDYGMKAGKQDKKEGRKANPAGHEDYQMADKRYRSEYGNRAKFVSGYQSAFNKAYKEGYAQGKLDKDAAEKAKQRDKTEKGKKTPENASPIKEKKMKTETAPSSSKTGGEVGTPKSKETIPPPPKPKPKKASPAEDAL